MADLEGVSQGGNLSLEKWVQEKKITVNLYNHLTSVEPPYNVELLLLLSQSDVKQLKHDFNNVNFTEILQLINVLKQLPQSQIYHDIMNRNKNEQECDRNILLINNTFDTMVQLLNDTKLSLIDQIKLNHLKREKLLQFKSI